MKNLTAAICLTIAVLVGCGWVSDSAGSQIGLTPAQEEDANLEEWIQSLLAQEEVIATGLRELTRLAEQGDATAQFNLVRMYHFGHGVPQDYVYARMWYNIAASTGDEIAQANRENLSKRMTPTQIEEAQTLARECVRKEYKGC